MTSWDDRSIVVLDDGDEVDIQAKDEAGAYLAPVTIWSVRIGRHVFVRSARGAAGRWYQDLRATGRGRISARGICQDVDAEWLDPDSPTQEVIDEAYQRKYGRYGSIVDAVVGPAAAQVTLRLEPTG